MLLKCWWVKISKVLLKPQFFSSPKNPLPPQSLVHSIVSCHAEALSACCKFLPFACLANFRLFFPFQFRYVVFQGKKKEGNAARYITRSQAVKYLQVSLSLFRSSLFLSIYPLISCGSVIECSLYFKFMVIFWVWAIGCINSMAELGWRKGIQIILFK